MKAKSIFFGFIGSLALLQYFQIDKTLPPTDEAQELHTVQNPPDEVFSILKKACYDCRSAKDTCDDNDANPRCCFAGMPDNLTSEMKIAGKDEPGERIVIRGYVYKADGKTPYPNVLMYAYQTDVKGIYSKKGGETGIRRWHGRLHGWCRTDEQGRYSIHTIRPASYPNSRAAAHIHHVVWAPDGSEPYYINDTVFADDQFVDDRYRANERRNGGSSGIIKLGRDSQGLLESKRIIVLQKH